MGHNVLVEEVWSGETSDLMIALHTRRSYPSIGRYAATIPATRYIRFDEGAQDSLELAARVVVLQ